MVKGNGSVRKKLLKLAFYNTLIFFFNTSLFADCSVECTFAFGSAYSISSGIPQPCNVLEALILCDVCERPKSP